MKIKKDGSRMWTEVEELGQAIRDGKVPPQMNHSCPNGSLDSAEVNAQLAPPGPPVARRF